MLEPVELHQFSGFDLRIIPSNIRWTALQRKGIVEVKIKSNQ